MTLYIFFETIFQNNFLNLFNFGKPEILRIHFVLKLNKFIKVESKTFIYLAPFLASISWKLSGYIEKIENKFFKTNFGFLLCGIFTKKK